jgi:hypothetical protein
VNVCPTCDKDFASVEGFDRHRVLLPKHLDPDPPTRRCLTTEELEAGEPEDEDGNRTVWTRTAPRSTGKGRFTKGGAWAFVKADPDPSINPYVDEEQSEGD